MLLPERGGCHVEILSDGQLEVPPSLGVSVDYTPFNSEKLCGGQQAWYLAPGHPPQLPAFARELLRPGTTMHLKWFCHRPGGSGFTCT